MHLRVGLVAAVLALVAGVARAQPGPDAGELAALPDEAGRDAVRALWRAVDSNDAAVLRSILKARTLALPGRIKLGGKQLSHALAVRGVGGVLGISAAARWVIVPVADPGGAVRRIDVREDGSGLLRAAVLELGPRGFRLVRVQLVQVMARSRRPALALVMLLDHSASVRGIELDSVKAGARVVVEALERTDQVGIIIYDGEVKTLVGLRHVRDAAAITAELAAIESGAGNNPERALEQALEMLEGVAGARRHVIIVSDGPLDGVLRGDLLQRVSNAGIRVSCVGLPDADRDEVARIATIAGGRALIGPLKGIPSLMADEVVWARE